MILAAISEAQAAGARLEHACEVAGISMRTIERWRLRPQGDDRRQGPRRRAANALSPVEEKQVLTVLTSSRYAGLSPKQLVPQLADEGLYLVSESTMYRVQRRHGLRRAKRPITRTHVTRASTMHRATGPNQVWSWDITWLPTLVRGTYYYLYLAMDVWSRRIVGWTVEEHECSDAAAAFIARAHRDAGIERPTRMVLHSDNGAPMRGSTMLSTLQWLGIVPSFSRPHVSDDNPFSESLFRTSKHRADYPRVFTSLDAARRWVARFVDWYNREHRHSGIRYVTPDERHYQREAAVLARRSALYERARDANPERWSRQIRNWSPVGDVTLNPDRSTTATT